MFEKRFNHDADTHEEVRHYFQNRAIQLQHEGVKLAGIVNIEEGAIATWAVEQNQEVTLLYSIFIFPKFRGKGLYKQIYKKHIPEGSSILTIKDCNVVDFFVKNSIHTVVMGGWLESKEYKAIEEYYGDRKAARSGVFLMNHIDEGLSIIFNFSARNNCSHKTTVAAFAYMLHPIVQSDFTVANVEKYLKGVDAHVIISAFEYARVANSYLSPREIKDIREVDMESPYRDILEIMLTADKIQNRKDFEAYHLGTHPRSASLDIYFKNWMHVLNISESSYQSFVSRLNEWKLI